MMSALPCLSMCLSVHPVKPAAPSLSPTFPGTLFFHSCQC